MPKTVGYNTKVFKDVFTNLDTFGAWKQTLPFDFPMSKETFYLIFYKYACSHIAFSEEDFKLHFANDLYTYVAEFEATTKAIKDLMSLTDEDIAITDSMVNNIANIPENAYNTDSENVNFISQQQKTISKKGKLTIKKEQLYNKNTLTTNTFLKRFQHLFIKILSPAYTLVYEEPQGD